MASPYYKHSLGMGGRGGGNFPTFLHEEAYLLLALYPASKIMQRWEIEPGTHCLCMCQKFEIPTYYTL